LPSFYRQCLLAGLLAAAASAAVVPRFDFDSLVERSDLIARARCLRSWSAWDQQKRFIWTHYELALVDPLKGARAATVVVSEPGGVVGDAGMLIEGVPRYAGGEEVVVFLYRTPEGLLRTRGLAQGKFHVAADPSTGQRRVRASIAGLHAPPEPLALDEFLRRIRGALNRLPGSRR